MGARNQQTKQSHNIFYMTKFEFNETNTFCISVNSERWERMERRFQQEKLQVTRWKASTPNTLIDQFNDFLNPLQKACAQSHIDIWRCIIQQNLPYGFIMEDDACFDQNWKSKLDEFPEDDDFDAIFLNASEPMIPTFTWDIVLEQYFGGGYILSQEGAKWLIRNFENNYCSTDWMTTRLQERGKSYSYFPWLIIQEGKDTTIGSGVDLDHQKVIICLNEINYSLSNYNV